MAVSLYNHSEAVTNHPPLYEWTQRGQGRRQMCEPLLTPGGRSGKFSGVGLGGGAVVGPTSVSWEGVGIWAFLRICDLRQ